MRWRNSQTQNEEKTDSDGAAETAFGVDFDIAPSFDPRGGGGAVLTGRF